MAHREENRQRDDVLDLRISKLVAGGAGNEGNSTPAEQVAREWARLATEESPRMSSAATAAGLNALRQRAAGKRAARRPNPLAFFASVPRWAQIAAVAIVVVLIANGVSNAAANSLPGSALYPFKRFTEGGQLLLQNTNAQRAQLWMNFANTRLDEVQRLLNTGALVDPASLDAVDDSILQALAEIAGTPRDQRVVLLQQLTQLAVRQQQIIDQLATNATPGERVRLEQTAKLLAGVAGFAQSPDALEGAAPFQFLTPTAAPTTTPTLTPTLTPQPTNTVAPTSTPQPTPLPTIIPAVQSTNENANDNANGNVNSNENENSNSNDNGSSNDQDNSNSNNNDNSNDNGGNGNNNDNGGDDHGNGNDNGGDDHGGGNDNSDDNSGSGNNNEDNSGSGNSGEDNSGSGNGGGDHSGNDNGGSNGSDDHSGSGNGGDDHSGSGGSDDHSGSGGGGKGGDNSGGGDNGNGGDNSGSGGSGKGG